MDKTDAGNVKMTEEIKDALAEAKMVAVEAMFELDPFDREAQKEFEDALDNL
jgi:hypothetical protein